MRPAITGVIVMRFNQMLTRNLLNFMAVVLVGFLTAQVLRAQPVSPQLLSAKVIPVTTSVTNKTVVFSWPVLPGKTELQKRASNLQDWESLAENSYKTNGTMISATVPLAKKEILYRVKRWPFSHRPAMAEMPPAMPLPPMPQTNHPTRFKKTSSP